jgi:hypothetical protein
MNLKFQEKNPSLLTKQIIVHEQFLYRTKVVVVDWVGQEDHHKVDMAQVLVVAELGRQAWEEHWN